MKLSKLTKPELERISNNANFTEEEQKNIWVDFARKKSSRDSLQVILVEINRITAIKRYSR